VDTKRPVARMTGRKEPDYLKLALYAPKHVVRLMV